MYTSLKQCRILFISRLRSRRVGLLGGSDLLRGLTVAHVLGAGLDALDVPVHGTGLYYSFPNVVQSVFV